MRIKQLRFQNLNSLVGEWSIDFADPAYTANGIFAITGPTGAGKTTILDAICLALYGRTPRLDRVNKSSNEIMSRQTGSCYAEISFETGAGEYYCHWSQQRARKKAEGELQPPKHEIADLRSGQILENKIRDVGLLVEQITGMSFIQFTRSMLLAQGGFAAFLQAPADERAPILEQITGTEIYSEISMQVHQRYREKKTDLEILQAEISAIKVMSDEDEQALQESLQSKIEQEIVQQEQLTELNEALTWLARLNELEKQVSAVEAQWQTFEQRQEAFREDRERLKQARQAMGLDGSYSQLEVMRKQQENENAELVQLCEEIPGQREVSIKAEKQWHEAARELDRMKDLRKAEGEITKKVRNMDSFIKQHDQLITDLLNSVTIGEGACLDWQRKIDSCVQEQQNIESAVDAIAAYLRENQMDTSLVTNLIGISRTFSRLEETAVLLQTSQKNHQQALAALQEQQKVRAEIKLLHDGNTTALESKTQMRQEMEVRLEKALQGHEIRWWRDELDKMKEHKKELQDMEQQMVQISQIKMDLQTYRESGQQFEEQERKLAAAIEQCQTQAEKYEREVELLEKQAALENRIRDLEEERGHLQDGSPCPLCGATNHPYAAGNLPHMDETELALQRARELLKQFSGNLHKEKLKLAQLDKEMEHCQMAVREAEERLSQETARCEELGTVLHLDLNVIKSSDDLKELLNQIEDKISMYASHIKSMEEMQQQTGELNLQYEACSLDFNQSDKALQQAETQFEQAQKDTERLLQEYRRIMKEVAELNQGALLEVAEYGISDLRQEELPGIMQTLTERKNRWVEKQAEQLRLQNTLNNVRIKLSQHGIQLQNQSEALQNDRRRLETLKEELTRQQAARFELYAERNPDEEEARLDIKISWAEAGVEQTRDEQELARSNQQRAEDRILILEVSTRRRGVELQSMDETFARQIEQAGFTDEHSYRLVRLPREEQQRLSARADQLAEQATELKTRLLDRQESLRQEKDKQLSDQPGETLEQKRHKAEEELKSLRDQIGAAKSTLQDSTDTRRQMQTQLQKIGQQKQTLGRWQVLHDLIGSADGKKYRNYAQGLTFDLMIGHANQQLQKMSDRYLLLRNPNQALELNVIDTYQAGEIRSTANLSGGESFLVSLALALGLSQMASHKVSVDSLFLDEGFGALDEDALDTALNTLAGLHQYGKLIGVISHVPALKERISTQIQVISQAGGRSIITGPGCQRVV